MGGRRDGGSPPPPGSRTRSSRGGDGPNLALLLLLYTLQGVPMGLAETVRLLLQERGATYSDQGASALSSHCV